MDYKNQLLSIYPLPDIYTEGKPKVQPKVVVSYNLSWATQDNNISTHPTEKKWVKKCRDIFKSDKQINGYNIEGSYNKDLQGYLIIPIRNKKEVVNIKLSPCTYIAALGIIDYNNTLMKESGLEVDIICIQETTDDEQNKTITLDFIKFINSKIIGGKFRYEGGVKKGGIGIAYKQKFGYPKILIQNYHFKERFRQWQIIVFKSFCIINGHFSHKETNIQECISRSITDVLSKDATYSMLNDSNFRIIFGGDFNNDSVKEIKLFGKTLQSTTNNTDIKTCCYQTNFSTAGDYIFDTNKVEDFGILPNFSNTSSFDYSNPKNRFGSDHLPVYSITS